MPDFPADSGALHSHTDNNQLVTTQTGRFFSGLHTSDRPRFNNSGGRHFLKSEYMPAILHYMASCIKPFRLPEVNVILSAIKNQLIAGKRCQSDIMTTAQRWPLPASVVALLVIV